MIQVLTIALTFGTAMCAWAVALAFVRRGQGNGLRRALLMYFGAQAVLWTFVAIETSPQVREALAPYAGAIGVAIIVWQTLAVAGLTWALYFRKEAH